MKTLFNRLIIIAIIIICLTVTGSQLSYGQNDSKSVEKRFPAPELTVTKDGQVTFEFDNTDIRVLIKYVSDLTGQNFIIDKNVRGTISVLTPTTIPLQNTMDLLESILEMQGYALVPSGDYIKVMKKKDAKRRAIPIILGENEEADAGELVTRVIRLKHGNPRRMYESLKHFSGDLKITAINSKTNSLMITGINSDINRMTALIKELDKPTGETQDIKSLILRYSKLTGKNIVVGEIGPKRVTLFSPLGLADEALLNSMETIISTAGLIMEERGDVIVIELDPDKVEVMEDRHNQEDHPGVPAKPRHLKRNG